MTESAQRRIGIAVLVVANLCVASWFATALRAGCARGHPPVPALVTRNHITYMGVLILDFRQAHRRYPTNLDELRESLRKGQVTEDAFSWFLDGWGVPLKYVRAAPKVNPGKVDLYSFGKNGVDDYDKEDFGDDIHLLPDDGVGYGRLVKGLRGSGQAK